MVGSWEQPGINFLNNCGNAYKPLQELKMAYCNKSIYFFNIFP
jgi:hypothetical protein